MTSSSEKQRHQVAGSVVSDAWTSSGLRCSMADSRERLEEDEVVGAAAVDAALLSPAGACAASPKSAS